MNPPSNRFVGTAADFVPLSAEEIQELVDTGVLTAEEAAAQRAAQAKAAAASAENDQAGA